MNYYDNIEGTMTYECDNADCDETSVFYGAFKECVAEAKQEGWKAYCIEGEWEHECPLCAQGSQPKDPRQVFG